MSEINIESLLKRASMLEDENDYDEALSIYNRILEAEPENVIANSRRREIKNNTLIIKRMRLPILVNNNRMCIHIDGERATPFFITTAPENTFQVTITRGKHTLSLWAEDNYHNSVPKDLGISYEINITKSEQTVYLSYEKGRNIFFSEPPSFSSYSSFSSSSFEDSNPSSSYTPPKNSGACYVATAVYGSYNCPQVWTLRRYRDNTLAKTWYGRFFIHMYYALSPTLVKHFGNTDWFKKLCKPKLDKIVYKLNIKGVLDTPYDDRTWE